MSEPGRAKVARRIETAKNAIADAQRDLATVLSEIEAGARAEKRHIGEPLAVALGRLRVALSELATLEDLLAD